MGLVKVGGRRRRRRSVYGSSCLALTLAHVVAIWRNQDEEIYKKKERKRRWARRSGAFLYRGPATFFLASNGFSTWTLERNKPGAKLLPLQMLIHTLVVLVVENSRDIFCFSQFKLQKQKHIQHPIDF